MKAVMSIVVALACGLCASGKCAAAEKPPAAEPAKQGIAGKVLQWKGDFMPPVDPTRGTRTPVSVPLYVFKGTIEPFEKPDPKHPALLKTTRSDKKGEYRVGIEPGTYTVVAEINGKLYLNSYQSDPKTQKNIWTPVEVEAGKWATWNIDDTSQATF